MTPTATPTPTPTATPSSTPEPQCPTGYVKKVENSVILCVAQEQNQNQNQQQNNNQNQNVNQNVNAQGGSSSSSSSSSSDVDVTINNNMPTPSPWNHGYDRQYPHWRDGRTQSVGLEEFKITTAVYDPSTEKGYEPTVIGASQTTIKELPKTGLPLLGLGLAGVLPGGLIFRKLSKKEDSEEETASSVWMKKQLKKD